MRFSEETKARTAECLRELWATTTEEKLLRAAGGNKWIARRAIELYKLGFSEADKDYYVFPWTIWAAKRRLSARADTNSRGFLYPQQFWLDSNNPTSAILTQ